MSGRRDSSGITGCAKSGAGIRRLAFSNFKSGLKNYLAVVASLAFTILVFLNFQNLIESDLFYGLGGKNKEYIDILIQVVSFVLGVFMFFFLWYATNVFLTKRKKEIGIYIFMGLTNQKIGRLYMMETTMIGLAALALGVGLGSLTTWLFQMAVLAISDIAVDISFTLSLRPVLVTAGIYLAMYLVFAVKGYVNIVRSSVLSMVSAARRNEFVRQDERLLFAKAVAGLLVLGAGYFLAIKEGGQEVMGNVFAATVLVVIGVYLLFGGFLPFLFQRLAKNKKFLYHKERSLWVNNVVFRMKKNYRTYAMTCVLMLCSVTALATGFAMKLRYEAMVHFRNTYTYQFMSSKDGLDEKIRPLIEKKNQISCAAEIEMLAIDPSLVQTRFTYSNYAFLPYSQVKRLAKETGLEMDFAEPKADEIVKASHLYLLSLLTDRSNETVCVNGKTYRQTGDKSTPYLGYLQECVDFYIVSDAEYRRLTPLGQTFFTYHYRIADAGNFAASLEDLDAIVSNTEENYTARVANDPGSGDIEWIKVLYTVCIVLFLVFILASGSILFMKLYNDAFEEKERCQILAKLGIGERTLKKSISRELLTAYALPFFVMAASSWFSVHALEKMMYTKLLPIYLCSVAVAFLVFLACYRMSVSSYVSIVRSDVRETRQ